MGIPSLDVSASSSASSGPSKSGDIGGGTAFNIGGINFGTDSSSAGAASTPSASASSFALPHASNVAWYLIGGIGILAAGILLYKALR